MSNLLVYRFNAKWLSPKFTIFQVSILLTIVYWWLLRQTSLVDMAELLVIVAFILVMTLGAKKDLQARLMRKQLTEQNRTINVLSAENERNRIGRDLHDSLGHTFVMMSVKSELALKQLAKGDYEAVKEQLTDLNDISHRSMQEVRQIINNLKYRTVTEELAEIERLFGLADVVIQIENHLKLDNLTAVQQCSITMVLRELSNNVIKHSHAKHCQLKLYQDGADICLTCQDDGKGFDSLTGQERHSIRDRLSLVNGQLDIVSSRKPTLVAITFKG